MGLLAAVIVTLFATSFGKPQVGWYNRLIPTSGVATPHYYQQPLKYLYPRMAHQTYFHANPFLAPYTYPVNFAPSNVMPNPMVQPYFFLQHCAKLKGKVMEIFGITDANLDGKISLAELRDDTMKNDPRLIAIWKEVFGNLVEDSSSFEESSDDKYSHGFDRPLFAKNDANKDNSLSVSEFFNFVGDSLDAGLLFEPTDTNRDYHIDATEYCASTGYCSDFAALETSVGSSDGKLDVVEYLSVLAFGESLGGGDNVPDFCARNSVKTQFYRG